MKRLTLVTLAFAVAGLVYGYCPGPNYPECDVSSFSNGTTAQWTCCDQDNLCPVDPTKSARFYRSEPLGYLAWNNYQVCFYEPIKTYSDEPCQCCGDPVTAPDPDCTAGSGP